MQSYFGWNLPIDKLNYWARGLYIPQRSFIKTLNDSGLLQTLEQSNWKIEYKNYMLYNKKYPLAGKIIFRYGNNLRVTLVIKSWFLNP